MLEAVLAAADAPARTAPNPCVGALVAAEDGSTHRGVTTPPGGPHAEIVAMTAAAASGTSVRDSTVFTTLEPCNHQGRTGPCTDALIAAGVRRVVVGMLDPDPLVSGSGVDSLRAAGISVEVGVCADEVARQMRSYVHHRIHGRLFVTLKMAATMDGRTAAADDSSQWITGHEARADVHALRAASDGVIVGAGTVRSDDPSLTVRHVAGTDPARYVLGSAPASAAVHPCTELSGDLHDVLRSIGGDGVIDLLVEGGAQVAADFHDGGFVDRYVIYLAPALMGSDRSRPLLAGRGSASMADVWRGQTVDVKLIGKDIRVTIEPGDDDPNAEITL